MSLEKIQGCNYKLVCTLSEVPVHHVCSDQEQKSYINKQTIRKPPIAGQSCHSVRSPLKTNTYFFWSQFFLSVEVFWIFVEWPSIFRSTKQWAQVLLTWALWLSLGSLAALKVLWFSACTSWWPGSPLPALLKQSWALVASLDWVSRAGMYHFLSILPK